MEENTLLFEAIRLLGELAFVVIIPFAISALRKWTKDSEHKAIYDDIFHALEAGVAEAHEEFVVWRKRTSDDGKLSKEERQEARNKARSYALGVLARVGQQAAESTLEKMSDGEINAIIRQVLLRQSKQAKPAQAGGDESGS